MVVQLTTAMTEFKTAPDYSGDETRWEAVSQRLEQADGAFFYAVRTTGVYCRPSCPSRQPRRENVRFFDSWQEAEQAGFRACKRCNPKSPSLQATHQALILQACQAIDAAETTPTLSALAKTANLSPFYFQRLFKRIVGLSPKQYAMERRLRRVQDQLKPESSVTEAMLEAGFASSSRFYQQTAERLGMNPMNYKNGGRGTQIRYALGQSSLGWVLVASTEKGICCIQLGDDPQELVRILAKRFPQSELKAHDASFESSLRQVLAFLESPRQPWSLPLDIQGTAFQRRVWQVLREIPAGSTLTYAGVAARIGQPKAARAVGSACANNKIAVAIPCHRVVREDGGLGGYRWGLERKQALLDREKEA